jgi:hypothetical protein
LTTVKLTYTYTAQVELLGKRFFLLKNHLQNQIHLIWLNVRERFMRIVTH